MHSKIKGTIAETAVMTDLYKQGYYVSVPVDDLSPFDLIAVSGVNYTMYKVQVKYRNPKNGNISLKYQNSMSNKNLSYQKTYTKEQVDVFAIYNPESSQIAYIPFEHGKKNITLRIDKPKNNQMNKIRMFSDYSTFPY